LAKQVTADKCAERLKAVADPDRLRVVNLLRSGPLTVGEMCDRLPMELAKLSHHLGVLRASDIVHFDKQGRHRLYRLNPEVASDLSAGALDFGCCRLELDKAWKPAAKKSE
jgi:DNA-binding transcriptional ArsR family regulator